MKCQFHMPIIIYCLLLKLNGTYLFTELAHVIRTCTSHILWYLVIRHLSTLTVTIQKFTNKKESMQHNIVHRFYCYFIAICERGTGGKDVTIVWWEQSLYIQCESGVKLDPTPHTKYTNAMSMYGLQVWGKPALEGLMNVL